MGLRDLWDELIDGLDVVETATGAGGGMLLFGLFALLVAVVINFFQ